MKKKLLIISLVLMLALTGCSFNSNEEENDNKGTTEEKVETQKVEVSRGEWNDDVYSNDFAKIKFNLPEGWTIATDEQIAQLMNVGTEMLNEDQQKLAELAEESGLYAMMASDPNSGANVIVLLEKPALEVTSEYYLNSVKQQLEAVESIDYTISDVEDKKISNEDYKALKANATVSGQTMEQMYCSKAVEDYIVSILITTTSLSDSSDKILEYFE